MTNDGCVICKQELALQNMPSVFDNCSLAGSLFCPFFHTSSVLYGQPVKKIYDDLPQKVEEETSFDFACPNLLHFGFFSQTKKSFFILSRGRWSEQLH